MTKKTDYHLVQACLTVFSLPSSEMQCQVNAKILSAIFVRQIGHSEQAREQDLHTALCDAKDQ